jgi:DNA-binding XRE family transcriptional regulator
MKKNKRSNSQRAVILQKIRKGGLQIMKEFNRKRYEMGQRIRKLRKRCDLCQEALAEKLGVSQVTVSRIENGDTKMDVEMLVRLSAILQAPLNVIVGVTDELTSPEIPL